MTLDDFERLMGASLYATWLETIPWTRETVAGFFAHGIPADYAERIAVISKGAIPVSSWPRVLHPPKVLQKRRRLSIVDNTMDSDHRLALSRSVKGKGKDNGFAAACRRKGFTQNSLAAAVPMDPGLLSKHRRGLRPIQPHRAERIHELIDWPADKAHWPGGIAAKD